MKTLELTPAVVFFTIVSPYISKPGAKRLGCHATSSILAGTLNKPPGVLTSTNLILTLRTVPTYVRPLRLLVNFRQFTAQLLGTFTLILHLLKNLFNEISFGFNASE